MIVLKCPNISRHLQQNNKENKEAQIIKTIVSLFSLLFCGNWRDMLCLAGAKIKINYIWFHTFLKEILMRKCIPSWSCRPTLSTSQPNYDNLKSHKFNFVTNMSHVRLQVSFTISKFGCAPSSSTFLL